MPFLCKSLRSGKLSEDDYRFILEQKLQLNTQVARPDANSVDLIIGQDLMELFLRSEEHTSELQSQFHLVCRLLLEKKNNTLTHWHGVIGYCLFLIDFFGFIKLPWL